LGGFAEPNPTPFQKSVAAIKAALDLNPAGGYVRASSARAALDTAFLSVPPCDAAKLFRELRFGNTPLARLFKYRLHPKTFREMLDILNGKVQFCLAALKTAAVRFNPAPNCTVIDRATESICHNAQLLCKVASELDEPDGWAKCENAVNASRGAAVRSRGCK
jgi:hypothetical protein